MSIFDLLFIAIFLATIVTFFIAAFSAIRGQGSHAIRILRGYGFCAGIYLAIVILVSLFSPRRVLNVGDPRCFDDWCLTVENVSRKPINAGVAYTVTLRLSSRARRVSQRENGIVVYLTDNRDRRYDPIPDASAVPLNALLRPQESITATRLFELPADAREVGLILTHRGGFPISWFIIGYDTWFRKPTIVRFP